MIFSAKSINHSGKRRQALYLAVVSVCLVLLLFFAFRGELPFGYQGQPPSGGAQSLYPAEDAYSGGKAYSADMPAPAGGPGIGKALRPKPVPEDWEFTIISTGDIMMHSPQTGAGRDKTGKSYDFAFMFEKITPILREADLVIGNLETTLAGEANGGYTGYPLFNAPEVLARNLKEAGFTLVSTANNHSLDRRYQGLCVTLDHLDEAGLSHTGTFRTAEERNGIFHTEVRGVDIGVIAATYGTNGLTLPGEYGFAVNYIDEAQLLNDVRKARLEGARYVIVMLHWGVEYQTRPNQEQEALAASLIAGGADLILGNHPHVLQRGEIVRTPDLYAGNQASDKEKKQFIMYSQGNFVSNQEGMDKNTSIILKLTLGVDGATGEPFLKEAGFIPIYTQKKNRQGAYHHIVWPLELALADLEAGGLSFNAGDRAAIPKAWAYALESQPGLEPVMLKDTPLWGTLCGQPASGGG